MLFRSKPAFASIALRAYLENFKTSIRKAYASQARMASRLAFCCVAWKVLNSRYAAQKRLKSPRHLVLWTYVDWMNGDSAKTIATAPETRSVALSRGIAWRLATTLGWVLVTGYFIFAAIILVTRYWVLPEIGRYAPEMEAQVSRAVGERVTIGSLRAHWQGLHPEVEMVDLKIHDRQGRVALSLPVVEAVIGWRSLLFFSLRLH